MIRLAIAEDHQSLIDGLKLQLEQNSDIQVVGTSNDGEQLIEIVRSKIPDVVITDIRMPKMDGISAVKVIKSEFPDIHVIAFTMFSQDEAVNQMLEAGAIGYILKNSSLQEVIEAIRTVSQGKEYYDGNIKIDLQNENEAQRSKSVLTNRQKEILELVAQGKTNREIADELFIGVYTVQTHRKNMIRILQLKGNGELLRYALERKYDFD